MVKLTKLQLDRLREIATNPHGSFGMASATTRALHELGLVDKIGGKVAKTGRVVWHAEAKINDAGRAALAEAR